MDFAAERLVFALQIEEMLLGTKEILPGPEGLEESAFPEDGVEEQHASKEDNREADVARTATLLLKCVRRGDIGH